MVVCVIAVFDLAIISLLHVYLIEVVAF